MRNRVHPNRFTPSFECLEDRRVLSLLGLPVNLPLAAAVDLQLSSDTGPTQQPLLGVQIHADLNVLSPLSADIGAAVDANVNADISSRAVIKQSDVRTHAKVHGAVDKLGVPHGHAYGHDKILQRAAARAGVDVGTDGGVNVGGNSDAETPPLDPPMGPDSPPTSGDGLATSPPAGQPATSASTLTAVPDSAESSTNTGGAAATLTRPEPGVAGWADFAAATNEAPVAYFVTADPLTAIEAAFIAEAGAAAMPEEAFRINPAADDLVPENTELLLDPSGLAAADLALQQILGTLSDLTRGLLNWFAMIGPAPFIMMGLASLAAMSELARWRLQKVRDIRRYASDW